MWRNGGTGGAGVKLQRNASVIHELFLNMKRQMGATECMYYTELSITLATPSHPASHLQQLLETLCDHGSTVALQPVSPLH